MFRALLKSKIHRVTATPSELHHQGSCAIDENLLDAAGIVEHEQIHVWNIANDERFVTYAMKGKRGTGTISVNGSATHRAAVGDVVIIAAFAQAPEQEVSGFKPKLIFAHEANRQLSSRNFVPVQQS
ncbi:MAG: aspartate 1-decarboxylase [Oxalobacteraceae bacterium]|nr:aspartate 1-decarboxylase [Oxalobacteraceae bacterium]